VALQRTPMVVVGGRGPHGLALHLLLADLGLAGVATLVDPSPEWLPLYGATGAAHAVEHLRSPRELDFALGDPSRAMTAWVDPVNQTRPLGDVYALGELRDARSLSEMPAERRARRCDFFRYANSLAHRSAADSVVVQSAVEGVARTPGGWRLALSCGGELEAAVVLLASGSGGHRYLPQPWRVWWQHLPAGRAWHVFDPRVRDLDLQGQRLAVVGSSNAAAFEAAIDAARRGARVTLLSRREAPIERQLPIDPYWFDPEVMQTLQQMPTAKRLRELKKRFVPKSTLPGTSALARSLGVRVLGNARVRFATELWGGVQLQWRDALGERAEHFDLLWAATGVEPRPRELPFLRDAVLAARAPVVVGGPARGLPITTPTGEWQGMPGLFPLGHFALGAVGFGAGTLASASRLLPLRLPAILAAAGVDAGVRAWRAAPQPLEAVA
jgi:threonine dehydrogenase-like Zn-dependent dehydrogenase